MVNSVAKIRSFLIKITALSTSYGFLIMEYGKNYLILYLVKDYCKDYHSKNGPNRISRC